MAKALRLCGCAVIIVVAVARPAAADWHFTPFIGVTFGGNSTFIGADNLITGQKPFGRKDPVVGGAVSWFGGGPVGIEGIFVYVPGIVDPYDQRELNPLITGSRSIVAMGNVVLTIPRAWNEHGLRPFVSGGVGLLHVEQTDLQNNVVVLFARRNVLGYNLGGGAIGFVSDKTGLRFEARRFSYLKAQEVPELGALGLPETLSYWTATVGVVIRY